MDLRNLVLRGFSTSSLCQGGDEAKQDPKWLGAKAQTVLLEKMRGLAIACEAIDADEGLSDFGRTKRKTELGEKALKDVETHVATIRQTLGTKLATAKERLAKAGRPVGESDIDRLSWMLSVQNHQRFLLDLDGQSLLGELARAVRDGDGRTYEAVTSLPVFILRQKGLTDDLMTASRKEWSRRIDPAAASDVEDGETMARLVDEDLATARRAIQQHCNLPEQREIRTL